MLTRRLTAFALGACLLGGLTACATAEPEPTPTPPFSSEEEAFAAAEETYRAYVDAENSDRATSTNARDADGYLTGEALTFELDGRQLLSDSGVAVQGTVVLVGFQGQEALLNPPISVTAVACIDVSGTRVIDEGGSDVTPSDRAPRQALDLQFVGSSKGLLIAKSSTADSASCSNL